MPMQNPPVGMAVPAASSKPRNRVLAYIQPRPDTTGDLEASSAGSAAISGGLQGLFSAGPVGLVGGAVGGFIGVHAGERAHGFTTALLAGGAAGASASLATAAGLAALAGAPMLAAAAVPVALAGALAGVAGTISGGRKARVRDATTGGFLAGSLSRMFMQGSLNGLVAGIAGGIGGRMANPVAGAVLSGLAGSALGALAGVPGGLHGMVLGAVVGGAGGVAGTVAGPLMQQAQRNLTADARAQVEKAIAPVAGRVGRGGLLAMGALGGAVGMTPLAIMAGVIFTPAAAVIPLAAGAGLTLARMLHMKPRTQTTPPAAEQAEQAFSPVQQAPHPEQALGRAPQPSEAS